jgi:predicted transcriptional regulator
LKLEIRNWEEQYKSMKAKFPISIHIKYELIFHMKISEIRNILKATVLVGDDQLDKTIVAGGGSDLMDDILSSLAEGSVLLTGITTEQVIQTAKVAGIVAVVFVRGKKPNENIIELASSYDMPILLTSYSMFEASGRLYMNGLRGLDGFW